MFANLRALLGAFSTINHAVSAAYGAFRVQREVKVEVSDGVNVGKRKYRSSEKYTALGEVEVCIDNPLQDPRGMNAHIVDESGDVHPDLFVTRMKQTGAVSRTTHIDMAADSHQYVKQDSQIALLVSMLSTFYVLEYKERRYEKNWGQYNDGHISVSLADILAPAPDETDWRKEEVISVRAWDQTTIDTPPSRDVIYVNRLNDLEVSIVCTHLAGRRRTTGLAFDLDIPPLVDEVLLSGCRQPPGEKAPSSTTAAQVRTALDKYVETNRLHGPFEQALAMYHQVALNPVPDTAEGLAWLRRKRYLNVPQFKAWRGAYSMILSDKAFGLDSAVTTTWKWWKEAGLATAVPAAQYNAVSLWGRYFVEGKYYHSDADVTSVGSLDFSENPGAAYYAYAALVTGGAAYCAVPAGLGLRFGSWDEGEALSYPVAVSEADATGYDIERREGTPYLVVKNVPPPASLIHVIGRMPAEGIFSNLSDNFEVRFDRIADGWIFPNLRNAWGFGMAARWLGYDTEMTYYGKTRISNWASNESSIALRPFHVDGPDRATVRLDSVTPRGKIWDILPGMGADENVWRVSVSVSDMFVLTSVDGVRHARTGVFLPPKQKDVDLILPPAEGLVYAPITIIMRERGRFEQAGFQIISQETQHHPQDPVSSGVEEQELDPGDEAAGDVDA